MLPKNYIELFKDARLSFKETTDEEMLMMLTIQKSSDENKFTEVLNEIRKKSFYIDIYLGTLKKYFNIDVQDKAAVFIACNLERPGIAKLFAVYTGYQAKKMDLEYLTFDDICQKIFPHGFLTESCCQVIWEIQKDRGDNLTDKQSFYDI